MGKKLTKSEKLDLILSELSELKGEIKKLLKHEAAAADQRVKALPRSAPDRRPKKAPKRTGAKPAADVEPTKSAMVQAPPAPQPAGRVVS
jgi:ElaB/YqjD/DUF883 family membrane-anchored ribosome-binding protein